MVDSLERSKFPFITFLLLGWRSQTQELNNLCNFNTHTRSELVYLVTFNTDSNPVISIATVSMLVNQTNSVGTEFVWFTRLRRCVRTLGFQQQMFVVLLRMYTHVIVDSFSGRDYKHFKCNDRID